MIVNINNIEIKDRIRKDFGNIQELADDIRENGLINPPVVTPLDIDDRCELIAGERRVRAMKLLGYEEIEVREMDVRDAEHQLELEISENETRKDFSKAERIDYAKRLERIESLKALERKKSGKISYHKENYPYGQTRDIVAEKMGIGSGKTYEREKAIVENKDKLLPEDFADWDEGKLSTNKAYTLLKKQLSDAQTENATLRQKAESKPTEVIKEVVPDDYDSIKEELTKAQDEIEIYKKRTAKLKQMNSKLEEQTKVPAKSYYDIKIATLETDVEDMTEEIASKDEVIKTLQEKLQVYEEDAKLVGEAAFLNMGNNEILRRLDSSSELYELGTKIQKLLEEELAPIKFKRCFEEVPKSDVAMENLIELVDKVVEWTKEMYSIIGDGVEVIDEI